MGRLVERKTHLDDKYYQTDEKGRDNVKNCQEIFFKGTSKDRLIVDLESW